MLLLQNELKSLLASLCEHLPVFPFVTDPEITNELLQNLLFYNFNKIYRQILIVVTAESVTLCVAPLKFNQ
jgi:hypothetical protein